MKKWLFSSLLLFICNVCSAVPTNTMAIPNTFTANTIIYSSEVNANFTEAQTKYNAHHHVIVSADITDGTIVNADINAGANITASKLDATVVETNTSQTISGSKTFSGTNTHSGDATFSGAVNLPSTGVVIGTPSAGVIWYDDGTDVAALAAGTSGNFLKCKGAAAPVWSPTGEYFEPDSTCVLAVDNGATLKELSNLGLTITLTSLTDADLVDGKVSPKCYNLDGTNDYFAIANNALHGGSSSLTMEAWIYPDTAVGDDTILSTDGDAELVLGFDSTNISGRIITSSGNETWDVAHGLSASGTGQWVYVVVTWVNTGAANIYVNGVDVGDGDNGGNGTVTDGADPIYVGADAAEGDKFDGKIDGVRILRREMGAAEVLDRYDAHK